MEVSAVEEPEKQKIGLYGRGRGSITVTTGLLFR